MSKVILSLIVCLPLMAQTKPAPSDLLTIVTREQVAVTGYSTGTDAYNCYTDVQRQAFERSRGWTKIVARLKADSQFRAVVAEIGELNPSDREQLLLKVQGTRRPTYAEFGGIDLPSGRRSTTEAGAYVESLISREIVKAVQEVMAVSR